MIRLCLRFRNDYLVHVMLVDRRVKNVPSKNATGSHDNYEIPFDKGKCILVQEKASTIHRITERYFDEIKTILPVDFNLEILQRNLFYCIPPPSECPIFISIVKLTNGEDVFNTAEGRISIPFSLLNQRAGLKCYAKVNILLYTACWMFIWYEFMCI